MLTDFHQKTANRGESTYSFSLELSGILKNDTILSMVVCNEKRRTNCENEISDGLNVEFGERGG